MKFKNEDGLWELDFNDKCFMHPIFEWEQLIGKWNWVTFHPIMIELENDKMSGGWEFTLILLGVGIRFRYNYAFEESEAGQRFAEFKKKNETKKL
jgi:hypothetical protein